MKILHIEDDIGIRETLHDLLEIYGYRVIGAADGKEGLRMALEGHPDIILCDIGLPGLDGFQVLEAVRKSPQGQTVPFIFVTAYAGPEMLLRAVKLGVTAYIPKPFRITEIIEAIKKYAPAVGAGPGQGSGPPAIS